MRFVSAFVVPAITGAMSGIVAAFVQANRQLVGSVTVHYGVVLALATLIAIQLVVVRDYETRIAGFGFLVGWLVVTVIMATETFGGDLAISNNGWAKVYVFGGTIVLSMVASLPPLRHPSDRTSDVIETEQSGIDA